MSLFGTLFFEGHYKETLERTLKKKIGRVHYIKWNKSHYAEKKKLGTTVYAATPPKKI